MLNYDREPGMCYVFGNYAMADETVLHTDRSVNACIDWAKRYCRRDLGGYECIEVCTFHPGTGEVTRHWHKSVYAD